MMAECREIKLFTIILEKGNHEFGGRKPLHTHGQLRSFFRLLWFSGEYPQNCGDENQIYDSKQKNRGGPGLSLEGTIAADG
jgi:hypothetical protein